MKKINIKDEKIIKLQILAVIFVILLGSVIYLRPDQYLTDRYAWNTAIGIKYFNIKNYKKSIEFADKAIKLDYGRFDAHYLMVSSLLAIGDIPALDREVAYYAEIFNGTENLSRYYWVMGWVRFKNGKIKQSEPYFQKGIEIAEQNSINYASLGLINMINDDLENARKNFELSLLYNDSMGCTLNYAYIAHMGLYTIYDRAGLNDKADIEYLKARFLVPGDKAEGIFFDFIS